MSLFDEAGFVGTLGRIENLDGHGQRRVFVIHPWTWADGLWVGAEGNEVRVCDQTGAVERTTNGRLKIERVDLGHREVTVFGNASDLTACMAGDYLLPGRDLRIETP